MNLTQKQTELLEHVQSTKAGEIFVQGPTYRTAVSLVKKGIGTFTAVSANTTNRGWFADKEI